MKKALLIGTGSVAKKHAINLINLGFEVHIFSETDRNLTYKNRNIKYIKKIENLKKFSFAIIANGTNKRIKYLNILLKHKIHIYCEKPIFYKKFNYERIKKKILQNNIVFFMGYQLLQNDRILYIKKILSKEKILSFNFDVGYDLKKWRENNSNKNRYFYETNKGGGVIFELIHEINMIQFLIGTIIYIKTIKHKTFNDKYEDIAVSIIKAGGAIGTLNQDMISKVHFRRIKILTKEKIILYDISNNKLYINNVKINRGENFNSNLLKKNLIFFIKLIKKKKICLFSYNQGVKDLKISIKMHLSK